MATHVGATSGRATALSRGGRRLDAQANGAGACTPRSRLVAALPRRREANLLRGRHFLSSPTCLIRCSKGQ